MSVFYQTHYPLRLEENTLDDIKIILAYQQFFMVSTRATNEDTERACALLQEVFHAEIPI